jgi:hypothetical protein
VENLIHITKDLIKLDEPFEPDFYNHYLKGQCIGYGFPIKYGDHVPILRKCIREEIYPFEGDKLLGVQIEVTNSILMLNISQFYEYLDDVRKSGFISLCDLIGIDNILIKFKTSFSPLVCNDFDEAVRLMIKNYWVQEYYEKSKRLRTCLDVIRSG